MQCDQTEKFWRRMVALTILVIVCAPVALSASPAHSATQKKLIEFGADEPDTGQLRANIRAMEKMPFDGVVLTPRGSDLSWSGFGATRFTWESLQPALSDLKATKFHRFTDCFLRFNVADVDWFADFSTVIHNARMAAWLCREGGLKGILFDAEMYNAPGFAYSPIGWLHYPGAKHMKEHSFAEYAAQVRRRGEEMMEAFEAEDPGITVFCTHGYSLASSREGGAPPLGDDRSPKALLASNLYGLYAPFLDGMYSAARDGTLIVDGFEQSYPYHKPEQFQKAYDVMHKDDLAVCASPARYERFMSAGFGVWLDSKYNPPKTDWSVDDFSKNAFTPNEWQTALTAALRRADRYAWVYCERPRWWPPVKNLPEAYIQATRKARKSAGLSNP